MAYAQPFGHSSAHNCVQEKNGRQNTGKNMHGRKRGGRHGKKKSTIAASDAVHSMSPHPWRRCTLHRPNPCVGQYAAGLNVLFGSCSRSRALVCRMLPVIASVVLTAWAFSSTPASDLQPLFEIAAPWLGADIATSVPLAGHPGQSLRVVSLVPR